MEEVRASSAPEDGQFSDELPDPFGAPQEIPDSQPYQHYESSIPNTSSLHNANLEATYNINTLPQPVYAEQTPQQPQPEEIHERDFDKRNERLRDVPGGQDDPAAAGMVALGDILKNRQPPYTASSVTGTSQPVNAQPPQLSRNQVLATAKPAQLLYRQAITVGLVVGLIVAPVIILLLIR